MAAAVLLRVLGNVGRTVVSVDLRSLGDLVSVLSPLSRCEEADCPAVESDVPEPASVSACAMPMP
ncbi:hypothetical protein [Mycobacterium sp. ACS4331]|uniref:hypothetical protein n=1 Tax=Mycobacterium sp. ACS4331 TaxID=1834121 RepID=UPI0018D2DFFB|nr:hypothetical protein [Mycobacterium sp. ACS4331]